MDKNIYKKIGEDWDFFFKIQNEDGSFEDFNGYSYSFILENKNKVEVVKDSGEITTSATEIIKSIPSSQTKGLTEKYYSVEFKIVGTDGRVYISDKATFHTIETLHHN